jgi:hypothetical protein
VEIITGSFPSINQHFGKKSLLLIKKYQIMKEKRKKRRFNLTEHPQVLDANSNKLIGKILDISDDGFKMITLDKMEQGKEYLLNIALPPANGETKFVDVKARVEWCVKEAAPELSTLGCYLVQVDVLRKLNLATIMLNTLRK